MLDKRTLKLLKYVAHICDDGSFKIIETPDLSKAVSSRADIETIRPMLKLLQDNEMIDVKYSDDTKYCLCVLPKGRVYIEHNEYKSNEVIMTRRFLKLVIGAAFIAAFAGAFLGALLFKFLF